MAHLAAGLTGVPNPPYTPRTPSHAYTNLILEADDPKLMQLVAMVNSDTAETLLSNGFVNEKYILGCTALCLQQEALVLIFTLMARGMTSSVGTLIATRLAESRATRNTGHHRIKPVIGAILCKGLTGNTPSSGIQALYDVQSSLPD